MKLTELKAIIDREVEDLAEWKWKEDAIEVGVIIASPGIGATPAVKVRSAGRGIDWDDGVFLIGTTEPLVVKSKKEKAFDLAVDLLWFLATKPTKRETYEIRMAKSSLKHAGYSEEDFKRLRNIFHKEPL